MLTHAKSARPDASSQRSALGDMMGQVRRSLAAKAARRLPRPLEDIDSWSDQTEVAFYEDVRPSRLI